MMTPPRPAATMTRASAAQHSSELMRFWLTIVCAYSASSSVNGTHTEPGEHADVVDRDVEAAELVDAAGDQRLDLLGIGDVGRQRDRAPAASR